MLCPTTEHVTWCQGMGKGVDFNLHIPQPSTPLGKSEAGVQLSDPHQSSRVNLNSRKAMRDMAQTVSGYQKLITDTLGERGREIGYFAFHDSGPIQQVLLSFWACAHQDPSSGVKFGFGPQTCRVSGLKASAGSPSA